MHICATWGCSSNHQKNDVSKYWFGQYWCQEETQNMGAWHFIDRRIEKVLAGIDDVKMKATRPIYVGRPECASTATGLFKRHVAEQEKLVKEALLLA